MGIVRHCGVRFGKQLDSLFLSAEKLSHDFKRYHSIEKPKRSIRIRIIVIDKIKRSTCKINEREGTKLYAFHAIFFEKKNRHFYALT